MHAICIVRPSFLLTLMCAAGLAALPAAAPVRAAVCVSGVVTAAGNQAPLPGSVARLVATGLPDIEMRADEDGRFAFPAVPPAPAYTLVVTSPGFKPWQKTDVTVDCARGTVVNAALEIAPLEEAITVEAAAVAVRSDAPEVSQSISSGQIRELPSYGRSATRLALLDPHVRNTGGLGGDGSTASRLSINANSFRHTAHELDGTTNYDSIFANAPQQMVSLAALGEMKVLTNQYSAEYGGSASGIIVATTRAGTNDYHGELFSFLRPSGVQAAPPVSTFRVPNYRLQSGAAAGGPVVRDRTYFFGAFERAVQDRGSFIQSPAPSMFVGDSDEWFSLARVDQRWSDRHSATLRINGNHAINNNVNDRIGGFTQPSAAQNSIQQALGVQASERAVFGSFFNELRAGYTNYIPSASVALSPQVSIVRPSYSTSGGSTNSWVRAQSYHLSDTAALVHGAHNVKFGGDYIRMFATDYSYTPFGEYRFAAGAPRANEHPQTYTQTFGQALLRYGQSIGTLFVQDDYHPHSRVTLNLGLRYERQSLLTERNNFAPRLGIAWSLNQSGSTVLRAGAGVFYDQYYMYITRRFYLQGLASPTATYSLPYGTPGFPDFPNSLAAPPLNAAEGKRDVYLPADKLYAPYSLQYSLGLQQRAAGWVFSVDGIYQHTLRQMRAEDVNHPAPFLRTMPGQRRTGAAADATRPFNAWDGVPVRNMTVVANSGSSLYDALDFGASRRISPRYQVEAHYVYSYSATYAMFFGEPNTGIPNDWSDTGRAERGPSDFYQRHRLVANGIAQLPGGAQVSLVGTVASGLPVNPITGVDNNGDTYAFDRPVGLGRNSYRGPAQAQIDASVSKRWGILRERAALELRVEAFNVLNRNNYVKVNNVWGDGATPAATFLAPLAGVANADPSRQLQAAIRVSF